MLQTKYGREKLYYTKAVLLWHIRGLVLCPIVWSKLLDSFAPGLCSRPNQWLLHLCHMYSFGRQFYPKQFRFRHNANQVLLGPRDIKWHGDGTSVARLRIPYLTKHKSKIAVWKRNITTVKCLGWSATVTNSHSILQMIQSCKSKNTQ